MEDTKIIELYWARNEKAIAETDLKYGKLCKQLARNILFDIEDAEEVLNEVYLGIWNAIPPSRPKYLKTFICKITKNVAMAKVRYYNADKRKAEGMIPLQEIEEIVSGKNNIEEEYEKKEISGFISEYLWKIESEKRNIFLSRYWYYNSISEIAKIYGLSESKVKTTLFRTRRKLKEYLKEKGVEKMRKRIITVLMVVMVVLSGCGNNEKQSKTEDKTTNVVEKTVTSADANSGKNKELVMYKKKDIIDKIKDAHVGIGLYMAMSRVVTIEDLKKILPVDNLREVGKDKLVIEYPMEDRTFIVVVVKNDERIMGTCVMRNVLRKEFEVSQIKKGMSLKKVRRIFPEVIINTRRPLILDKSRGIDEFPACEVILDNNKMAWISFENNNGKYVVSDINIQKNPLFEDKEWKKIIRKYDGNNYSLIYKPVKGVNEQRERFYELTKSSIPKYKYLVERSGKMPNAKYMEHGFYLVNDKSLTYRQLMWSRLSSNSNDWIDFRTVFTEIKEK